MKLRLVALVALVVCAAVGLYIHADGGLDEYLRRPPLLDPSTPATQDGYTLVEMRRLPRPSEPICYGPDRSAFQFSPQGYGGSALWIGSTHLPAAENYPNSPCSFAGTLRPGEKETPVRAYARNTRVTGTASNGDVFPLEWWLMSGKEGEFLMVQLPAGYPDTYRYIDVSLADAAGHKARWRIARLPKMTRALPQTAKVVDHAAVAGFDVRVAARWSGSMTGCLEPDIVATAPPGAEHQWELACSTPIRMEWQPLRIADRVNHPHGTMHPSFTHGRAEMRGSGSDSYTPYPQANRFCRLDVAVRQYETYSETITFRDVTVTGNGIGELDTTGPDTLTTPSGLVVTLSHAYPRNERTPATLTANTQVQFRLLVPQANEKLVLPKCPLARQFHRPVSVRFDGPPGAATHMWSSSGKERQGLFELPKGAPRFYREFPVTVTYRVDLQSYPMTFTVPIGPARPVHRRPVAVAAAPKEAQQ